MRVRFRDKDLERLEIDSAFSAGLDAALVKSFRKRIQGIRAAVDERDLYEYKAWRFEKLKGNRSHQRSFRLNDQFRLIVEIEQEDSDSVIAIVSIDDYH